MDQRSCNSASTAVTILVGVEDLSVIMKPISSMYMFIKSLYFVSRNNYIICLFISVSTTEDITS